MGYNDFTYIFIFSLVLLEKMEHISLHIIICNRQVVTIVISGIIVTFCNATLLVPACPEGLGMEPGHVGDVKWS